MEGFRPLGVPQWSSDLDLFVRFSSLITLTNCYRISGVNTVWWKPSLHDLISNWLLQSLHHCVQITQYIPCLKKRQYYSYWKPSFCFVFRDEGEVSSLLDLVHSTFVLFPGEPASPTDEGQSPGSETRGGGETAERVPTDTGYQQHQVHLPTEKAPGIPPKERVCSSDQSTSLSHSMSGCFLLTITRQGEIWSYFAHNGLLLWSFFREFQEKQKSKRVEIVSKLLLEEELLERRKRHHALLFPPTQVSLVERLAGQERSPEKLLQSLDPQPAETKEEKRKRVSGNITDENEEFRLLKRV